MKQPLSEQQGSLSTPHPHRIETAALWIFSRSIIIAAVCTLLVSCETDVKTVSKVTSTDSLPVEIIKDLEVVQSEKGINSFKLSGTLMERYEGDDPYIEFPEGVHIVFYDSLGNIRSELTADYGISYEKRKIMEAKRDVEVINYLTEEKLNTEHLIWNQNKRLIYSDVFVKITTDDKVIYGQNGMEADEQFESWKLKKVKGDILIDQDEY